MTWFFQNPIFEQGVPAFLCSGCVPVHRRIRLCPLVVALEVAAFVAAVANTVVAEKPATLSCAVLESSVLLAAVRKGRERLWRPIAVAFAQPETMAVKVGRHLCGRMLQQIEALCSMSSGIFAGTWWIERRVHLLLPIDEWRRRRRCRAWTIPAIC
jgi:hypothetical protein